MWLSISFCNTFYNFKVVGLARRIDRLEEIKNALSNNNGQFYCFQADVTKEQEILQAFSWTTENVGPPSILVNSAGIFKTLFLSTFDTEDARQLMDLNVISLAIAMREAIKSFNENNISGHIINLNSISGQKVFNIPGMTWYTTSKYAARALTEAMNLEIRKSNKGTKITVRLYY